MAENLQVEVTGKSKYEVAHHMAIQMLISIEKKKWGGGFSRQEYLRAHYDAMMVLSGIEPK